MFVDILRRTCFLYLSYIKGNGRCGHFATSFVFLNFFIFPTVKLRYITRGDFIIPGGDFFLHGGDFVLPGANDTTAHGRLCPVLFSPGGGHCPGHVLPPETLYRYRFSGGLVLGGPTYHRTPAVKVPTWIDITAGTSLTRHRRTGSS